MKAIVCDRYGTPSVLRMKELPQPMVTDSEILVRVIASTVNRTDCAILSARPFIMRFFTGLLKPSKVVPGTEFAGVVTQVGSAVTRFQVGQRVFGFHDLGLSAHAEYLSIAADAAIAEIPAQFNFAQAAASIEGAHYAYNYINKIKINAGDKILINGASGAIGTALLQFCVALGAEVTVVSAQKHTALLLSLGARNLIDYTTTDFTQQNASYDFVFDVVGTSSYRRCRHLLSANGIYISSELGRWSQNLYLPLLTRFFVARKVIFPFPASIKESLEFIQQQISLGQFAPVIDTEYCLDDLAQAFTYVLGGHKTGNVVVRIADEV